MGNNSILAPVSVIIPCFKAGSFLERAVDSVLNQTLRPAELILVDDASPDAGHTKKKIVELAMNIKERNLGISPITIFMKNNSGPGSARNAGWEKATQPWIAFLDADDAWAPNKIEVQYATLQKNDEIALLAHGSSLIKPEEALSKTLDYKKNVELINISLYKMLFSNKLSTRSIILKREIPLRFLDKSFSEDYSLWLHILSEGYKVCLMDCTLAYIFRPEYGGDGYSSQLWKQEKRELNTLKELYHSNKINFLILLLAYIVSLLKYMRRTIIKCLYIFKSYLRI